MGAGSAIFYDHTKTDIETKQQEVIKDKWEVISLIDISDLLSIEKYNIFKQLSDKIFTRITIINNDGKVLIDTSVDYDKIKNLENHALRDEVRYAKSDEPLFTIRYSDTTLLETVYYAKRLNDNLILRLAYNYNYTTALISARENALLLFAILSSLIAIVIYIIAYKITYPIKQLDMILDNMKNRKLDFHFAEFSDTTMNKISSEIYNINANFIQQNNQLLNEKDKLSAILSMMDEAIILMTKTGKLILYNNKAKELLNTDLYVDMDILSEIKSIALINFFSNIISIDDELKREIKFNNMIFNLYAKTMNNEILIVFTEVTAKAHYEDYKAELVGNITHELKTPLSLLIGISETILDDKNMSSDMRDKFLKQINNNAIRLNDIINDTLELYRLESETDFNLIDKSCNTDELISELKSLIKPNDNCNIIYANNVEDINIRYSDMLSILSNLISNAIKYTDSSEILISIEKYKKTVIIKVSDEGPAIPQIERSRIFERFYTVSKSRSKQHSGTGLGLSIVKHIASQYYGKISLYDNINNGNTFEIILKEKQIE